MRSLQGSRVYFSDHLRLGTRAAGAAEYTRLMTEMQPSLMRLYAAGGDTTIRKLLDDLLSHGDNVAGIQGVHRRLLLRVERHLRAKTLT
jgi:hypothetical protein